MWFRGISRNIYIYIYIYIHTFWGRTGGAPNITAQCKHQSINVSVLLEYIDLSVYHNLCELMLDHELLI